MCPKKLPYRKKQQIIYTRKSYVTEALRLALSPGLQILFPPCVTSIFHLLIPNLTISCCCHSYYICQVASKSVNLFSKYRVHRIAGSTDWQRRPDSHVQQRRFQAGLLQCTVEWHTSCRAFSVVAPSTWNSLPADFDSLKIFSLSNATWKPICSNSLSPPVLHQAPLYLRT